MVQFCCHLLCYRKLCAICWGKKVWTGIPVGVTTVVDGIATVVDGVATVVDGVATFVDCVATVVDGVATVLDGVSTVVDSATIVDVPIGISPQTACLHDSWQLSIIQTQLSPWHSPSTAHMLHCAWFVWLLW